MTTPIDAPPAPLPEVKTGDVNCGAVVVGSGNNVTVICQAPGAQANPGGSVTGAVKKQELPINLLPDELEQDLVGRDADSEALMSASQAVKKVSLWGDDGMGKTALVRKFSYAVRSGDASRNIAYIDALGQHGEDLQLLVYDAFFDRPEGFIPNPTQMRNGLQNEQALIVLDNLGVPANEIAALTGLAPKCSFILISTLRVVKEGKAVSLGSLAEPDAIKLFEEIFGRPLDDEGRQAAARVCQLLEGRPGFIVNAAAHADGLHESPAQLLDELNALPAINEQSFATFAVSRLTEDEQTVLKFLAAAGQNPVTTAQLVFALPDIDVQAVLAHLKSLRLAQSHSPRFSLVGTLPAGLALAFDLTASRNALLQSSIDWLLQQPPSKPVEDSISMMLHVLQDAASRLQWSAVIRLGRLLEPFAFRFTRWQAWADILDILLGAAKATGNLALQGWALHQLGTRALAQGALKVASSNLNQALRIRQSLNDHAGLEVTRHNLHVLKAAASAQGSGPGGANPLTYGFFGIGGIIVIAAAAYFLTHRPNTPPSTPVVPPPAITTSAPLAFTETVTPTGTSTPTQTPTSAPTDTPTATPTEPPTDTPAPQGPFGAIVTVPDKFLACHYGPGAVYFQRTGLPSQAQVKVIGKQDTAFGTWVYVNYVPPFTKGNGMSCWVNPQYLKMDGDPASLPSYYPDKAPLVLYYHPGATFPAPTNVSASRDGNLVNITWNGYVLYPGDREYATAPLFLVEAWTCINGQFLLSPVGVDTAAHTGDAGTFIDESVDVQDDGNCGQRPYGNVYLAQRDGYVGPAPVIPWP